MTRPNAAGRARRTRRSRSSQPSTTTASATARRGAGGGRGQPWRAAGLLHDFDYERFPETHPLRGAEELGRLGYPDDLVEAVLGHGDHTGVPRTSLLARTVYACDELTGFIIAVAYVRPNRSLDAVDVRSVEKKMRDKGFARQGPRDQPTKGPAGPATPSPH